ncbi:hypothetical protein AMTRI_Chr01g110330 [Amborella trichopoda]
MRRNNRFLHGVLTSMETIGSGLCESVDLHCGHRDVFQVVSFVDQASLLSSSMTKWDWMPTQNLICLALTQHDMDLTIQSMRFFGSGYHYGWLCSISVYLRRGFKVY